MSHHHCPIKKYLDNEWEPVRSLSVCTLRLSLFTSLKRFSWMEPSVGSASIPLLSSGSEPKKYERDQLRKKTRSEIFPDSEIGLGFGLNRGRNISVGNWWRHSCSFCPLTMLSCAHRPTALLRYVLLNRCVIVILTQQIRRFQSHKNTIWTSDLSATGQSYKPLEFQLWDP